MNTSGDELKKLETVTGVPAEKLLEHSAKKIADAQATGEPLPGAVRDAFSLTPDIKVGSYTVRACLDFDIELLSMLNHPLNEMRLAVIASEGKEVPELFKPSGSMAWELCFIFTTPVDELDELVGKLGLAGLKNAAKARYSRLQPVGLATLSAACIKQYLASWNPALSYGEAEQVNEEGEPVKKNPPA